MRRHAAALIAGGVLSIADAGNGAPPAAAAPTETPDFVIEGDVHGLHPGEHTTLDAMVENPYDVDLTVTSIEVVARDAGPACPGSLLGFDASRASAVVPARSTAVVPIGIALDRSTPDACQGASWPLLLTATAVAGSGRSTRLSMTGSDALVPAGVAAALVVVGLVLGAAGARRRDATKPR